MIERRAGIYKGRSKSSTYKDLVWTVATASDTNLPIEDQTKSTLETIQKNLLELNSNKSRIVSAQVYITKMADKPIMDRIWNEWIGGKYSDWPQRACLGVELEGNTLVEVAVTAVRDTNDEGGE